MPKAAQTPAVGTGDDRAQRYQHDEAEVDRHESDTQPEPRGRSAHRPARGSRSVRHRRGVELRHLYLRHFEVETPMPFSMPATIPVSGSKNFLVTSLQPPRSLIRNSTAGSLNSSVFATPAITGR